MPSAIQLCVPVGRFRYTAGLFARSLSFEPCRELLVLPEGGGLATRRRAVSPSRGQDRALQLGVLQAERIGVLEPPAGHEQLDARDAGLDLAFEAPLPAGVVGVAQDVVGQLLAPDRP